MTGQCQWNANGTMSCYESFNNNTIPTYTYSINVIVMDPSQTHVLDTYSFPNVSSGVSTLVNIRPKLVAQTYTSVTLNIQDMTMYYGQPPLTLYVYTNANASPILLNFNSQQALNNVSMRSALVQNLPYNNITVTFARSV